MTWHSAIWRYDLRFLQVQKNVLILLYCLFSCLFIALWGFPLTGKEKNFSHKGDIYWHFICDCEDPSDHLKIIWTTLHQKKKKIHFFITVFFVFNAFELFPAVHLTNIRWWVCFASCQTSVLNGALGTRASQAAGGLMLCSTLTAASGTEL